MSDIIEDDGESETGFTNFYCCPRCDHDWQDEWSCACDDECPECGARNISPYYSSDGEDDGTEQENRLRILRLERLVDALLPYAASRAEDLGADAFDAEGDPNISAEDAAEMLAEANAAWKAVDTARTFLNPPPPAD